MEINSRRKPRKKMFFLKKLTYTKNISENGILDAESNIRSEDFSLFTVDFACGSFLKFEKQKYLCDEIISSKTFQKENW